MHVVCFVHNSRAQATKFENVMSLPCWLIHFFKITTVAPPKLVQKDVFCPYFVIQIQQPSFNPTLSCSCCHVTLTHAPLQTSTAFCLRLARISWTCVHQYCSLFFLSLCKKFIHRSSRCFPKQIELQSGFRFPAPVLFSECLCLTATWRCFSLVHMPQDEQRRSASMGSLQLHHSTACHFVVCAVTGDWSSFKWTRGNDIKNFFFKSLNHDNTHTHVSGCVVGYNNDALKYWVEAEATGKIKSKSIYVCVISIVISCLTTLLWLFSLHLTTSTPISSSLPLSSSP